MLRERLSPEQIAGKLRSMNIPNLRNAYVCRETIYNAIYALPVGELYFRLHESGEITYELRPRPVRVVVPAANCYGSSPAAQPNSAISISAARHWLGPNPTGRLH